MSRLCREMVGGTIRHKKENHAYVLAITSLSGLINVIPLMNGYLRIPKLHQFNNLINWINNNTGQSISINSIDASSLLSS